jgi:hypothetical protein
MGQHNAEKIERGKFRIGGVHCVINTGYARMASSTALSPVNFRNLAR